MVLSRSVSILLGLFVIAGCGPAPPSARLEAVAVKDDALNVSGSVAGGGPGLFHVAADYVDERGCRHSVLLDSIRQSDEGPSRKFALQTPLGKHRMRSAQIRMQFWKLDAPVSEMTDVLNEERVVDETVNPPSTPRERCSSEPRNDDERISAMGREELVATAINTAGYLCARVTDMYPTAGGIMVHCVEYRSGQGRVKYLVDADAGTVTPQ